MSSLLMRQRRGQKGRATPTTDTTRLGHPTTHTPSLCGEGLLWLKQNRTERISLHTVRSHDNGQVNTRKDCFLLPSNVPADSVSLVPFPSRLTANSEHQGCREDIRFAHYVVKKKKKKRS